MTTAHYVTKTLAAGGNGPDIETFQGLGRGWGELLSWSRQEPRRQFQETKRKVAEIKKTLRE